MMEQKVTFGNLAKYGVLLGLVLIILSLIKIYVGNFIEQDIKELIFMLLKAAAYVFFIYSAIRFAIKHFYATNYSFAKGVKVGLFLGLIAAVFTCVYQYIEMKFIIPDVYQAQIELAIEEMLEKGVPEEMGATVRSMFSISAIVSALVGTFLVSLLASLFIAPFFKKQQIINIEEASSSDNQ
ncbi:MAG: DUF4199 domain-containing protein [Bacteroidales bacterium]|nr:DUF4199 domain-containing protein [Bacteroidales bacterium]